MKVLQVNSGKAEYLLKNGSYASIIDITKEDIYYLAGAILDNDIETDIENGTDKKINNDVERVMYTNIRLELEKIEEGKTTLNTSINDLFKDSYDTYKTELEDKIKNSGEVKKNKTVPEKKAVPKKKAVLKKKRKA